MAKAVSKPTLSVSMTFEVNEIEARALDALAGYGDDAFIKAFYDHLGKTYMENHEDGLRSFLASIRSTVAPAIRDVDSARQFLEKTKKKG